MISAASPAPPLTVPTRAIVLDNEGNRLALHAPPATAAPA